MKGNCSYKCGCVHVFAPGSDRSRIINREEGTMFSTKDALKVAILVCKVYILGHGPPEKKAL